MANSQSKFRFWSAVCYPENMVPDWEETIGDILQIPYAYAFHDSPLDLKGDKPHVHLILCWSGPTTRNCALQMANLLSLPGLTCCSTVQFVSNIEHMYNYLIHDTDDCRRKGKYLYPASSRHEGNGFDVHFLRTVDTSDKLRIRNEIRNLIFAERIDNFALLDLACGSFPDSDLYVSVLHDSAYYFQRICDGVYQLKRNGYFEK